MYRATLAEADDDQYDEATNLVEKLYSKDNARCRRGKATSIVPNQIRINLEHTIRKFGEIPVLNIYGFYGRMFGEYLDAEDYGFKFGILELVGSMRDTIEVYDNGSAIVCRPAMRKSCNTTCRPPKSRERGSSKNLIAALNGSDFWDCKEAKYLEIGGPKIVIYQPPVASCIKRNERAARSEFNRIFALLEENPYGVHLLEFDQLYFNKFKRNLDLLYLNFTSLGEMVNECPEIFYTKESQQDILLFDGRHHTYPDLAGKNLNASKVEEQMTYLVEGHIFQKTLLIVDSTKLYGLPVNIYLQTLQANFKIDNKMLKYLNEMTSITIFRMMARLNLVEVMSAPDCKNDVRVFLTKKFDYASWVKRFRSKYDIAVT